MVKKKAVAYIRVSTQSDAQLHSFEYQVDYWKNTINEIDDCEYVGIYADKGISGKALAKRPQQLKLIADARMHKFDIVFTKSVSRFARNTEELLEIVRELRELGIKIWFEKEKIDTFNPTAETYLIIAASIAENDLKIYSENMKWSIRQRYKKGWISIGNGMFGYRMVEGTNDLEIVPDEADTVRRIYELYLEGRGLKTIADILKKENRKNKSGEVDWNLRTISYVLSNEKYKGCVLNQKRVVNLGVYEINNNLAPKYYMESTHEAIISPDVFDKVQRELERRTNVRLKGGHVPSYGFSKLVQCAVCKKTAFAHKIQNCGKPWQTEIWVCQNQNIHGIKSCSNKRIKDTVLKEKFVESYNEFIEHHLDNDRLKRLKNQITALVNAERELKMLYVNRMLNSEDYKKENTNIRNEIAYINDQITANEMRGLSRSDYKPITEYDEDKVNKFIESVSINHSIVTFKFINGVEISREFTNGSPGNKKGWYAHYLDQQRYNTEV